MGLHTRWPVTPGLSQSQISVLEPKGWRERERGQEDPRLANVGLALYLDLLNYSLRGAELRVQTTPYEGWSSKFSRGQILTSFVTGFAA